MRKALLVLTIVAASDLSRSAAWANFSCFENSRGRATMRLRRRGQLRRNENLGQLQIRRSMRRPGAWRDHLQLQGGQERKDGPLTRATNFMQIACSRAFRSRGLASCTSSSHLDGGWRGPRTVLEPGLQITKGGP